MIENKIAIPYPFPLNLPSPYPGTPLHQQAEKQFKTKINWNDVPKFAGRVGTDFFEKVTPEEIQRLAYKYKLKQEGKRKNKHYFRLLLKSLLKRIFASANKRLPSRR